MSCKVFVVLLKQMFFFLLICLPMFCRYTMWWSMGSLGLAFVFTWYQSKCHWLELIWLAFRSFARGGRYWSCFSAIVSSHNINTTSLYATIKTRSAAAISHFECSRLGFLLLYASCEERQRALLTNSIVVEFFESTAATSSACVAFLEQIKISLIPCIFHYSASFQQAFLI